LFYGLGLGALWVSGGCGESGTEGVRPEATEEVKERSAKHGKRVAEYYAAKNAGQGTGKPGKAGRKGNMVKGNAEKENAE
jgi:hypothetical protein